VSGNLTLKIHNINEKPYTVGDLVTIIPRLGTRLAVGEVMKIEKVDNFTNFIIKPADVYRTWNEDFAKDLIAQDQEIYVIVFRKPSLAIEVAIGRKVDAANPRPIDPARFSLSLDNNGDGKVTDVEAIRFVNNAAEWSQGAGLPFKDLADGIPTNLPVTRVSVNFPSLEMTHFNDLAVRVVYDRSSRPMLYVPFQFADLTGAGINSQSLDTDPIKFGDFMDEVQNEFIVPVVYPGSKEPGWPLNKYTLTVIDKVARIIVVTGEEIASIKKVKKCNKCYYKIGFVDSGLVPSINAGSYQNCLLSFENFAMRPLPTC
jgi:hypothetical protein